MTGVSWAHPAIGLMVENKHAMNRKRISGGKIVQGDENYFSKDLQLSCRLVYLCSSFNQKVKPLGESINTAVETGTEQRIFEAAREEFIVKGLEGAKMQDIADRAGINKALLHYYFRTKERLFEAVAKQVLGRVFPVLRNLLESELPLEEKLDQIVDMYVETVSRNSFVPLFVITEMNKRPQHFFERILPGELPKPQKLVQQLETAAQEGRIRAIEPVHLVSNILAMCVFPFLARPMLCGVMGLSDQDWKHYVDGRKAEIKRFVRDALRP